MAAIFRLHNIKRHLASTPASIGGQSTGAISTAAQKVLDTRKEVRVLDSYISYLDTGPVGDKAVIFLHGNPTAAFLWRNVIPHVSPIARCLAPDFIGMGRSGKEPNGAYRFVDHYRYLCAWIDAANLPQKVTVVGHDWGSGLGFHWGNLHRDRVEALVFMEAMVNIIPSWDVFPEVSRKIFKAFRSPAGEGMILKKNVFMERLFPASFAEELPDEVMAEYQRPYLEEGESRRPLLTWPRDIPIGEEGPDDVIRIVNGYKPWLATSSDIPKLYVDTVPGFYSPGIRISVAEWPNLKVAKAKGHHFLQEEDPDAIGHAIADFLRDVYTQN